MKIESTKNYDLFASNPLQRTFTERRVGAIKATMSRDGFWPSHPISVYKEKNGKLTVNFGHHRLAAAKELQLPVLYVVTDKASPKMLAEEGNFTAKWKTIDQAKVFAKQGNKHYVELLQLADRGIPIAMAASMLSGESANSGNYRPLICMGTFKIKTREFVDKWLELSDEFGGKVKAIYHRNFISCYSKCLFTPEFDNQVFVQRLRKNPLMLDVTSNEDQMMSQIEEIYNFRTQSKIPLAFIVTENSRKRKVNFGELKA